MKYEWDTRKAASNEASHGVPFEAMERFDWSTALVIEDPRGYDEPRFLAYGFIRASSRGRTHEGDRVHTCAHTYRGDACRIISLWKSNNREIRRYRRFLDAQEDQDE